MGTHLWYERLCKEIPTRLVSWEKRSWVDFSATCGNARLCAKLAAGCFIWTYSLGTFPLGDFWSSQRCLTFFPPSYSAFCLTLMYAVSGWFPSPSTSVVFWSSTAPSHFCLVILAVTSHINRPVRPNGWSVKGGFARRPQPLTVFSSFPLNASFLKSNCTVHVAACQGPYMLCTFLPRCLCLCV